MWNNLILRFQEYFLRHIVIFVFFPITTFFSVFIACGDLFQKYLVRNSEMYNIYELSTFFIKVEDANIPIHIKDQVFDMAVYSYVLFLIWFILFFDSGYFNPSRRQYNFLSIFIKLMTFLLIHVFTSRHGIFNNYSNSSFFSLIGYNDCDLFIILRKNES